MVTGKILGHLERGESAQVSPRARSVSAFVSRMSVPSGASRVNTNHDWPDVLRVSSLLYLSAFDSRRTLVPGKFQDGI